MKPDEVMSILTAYRANQKRLVFLQEQAEEMRRGIALENLPEMHAVRTQKYTGLPARSANSSIVEDVALHAVDGGETADSVRWRQELAQIEAEIYRAQRNIRYVDIWLSGLSDKQRAVVTAHTINKKTWPYICVNSETLIGVWMSESGLRNVHRAAISTILNIAR